MRDFSRRVRLRHDSSTMEKIIRKEKNSINPLNRVTYSITCILRRVNLSYLTVFEFVNLCINCDGDNRLNSHLSNSRKNSIPFSLRYFVARIITLNLRGPSAPNTQK